MNKPVQGVVDLRRLADLTQDLEVEFPDELPWYSRRLMAALGVKVKIVPQRTRSADRKAA